MAIIGIIKWIYRDKVRCLSRKIACKYCSSTIANLHTHLDSMFIFVGFNIYRHAQRVAYFMDIYIGISIYMSTYVCITHTQFLKRFYLFILDRGERREKERETSICGCLSCIPYWWRGLQPRHVPWLGIELVTPWFTDWHLILWVMPPRAITFNF